ncbi:MAG: hypothetical protein IPF67_10320 [Saprospiraceae bacterium]|nr:hypothetical protein [Candidatus Brachybacter algidus]
MEAPFITKFMDPVGVFAIQQEFDQEYTITSLHSPGNYSITLMRSAL